ncbi:MAG: hypothetical protein ACE37H_02735 [Phycisphaeraceae bacterium]
MPDEKKDASGARPDTPPTYEPLEPDRLTWAVLLAKWTEFARAGVALPESGEAGRVRRSVTDIIALQAVWFALRQLDELDRSERALGLDRAGVLIDRHASAIADRFADQPVPDELQDLVADVRAEYANQKSR